MVNGLMIKECGGLWSNQFLNWEDSTFGLMTSFFLLFHLVSACECWTEEEVGDGRGSSWLLVFRNSLSCFN